ncbi:MAG: hypothetical protein ACREHE_15835 [Rhizomicrobium sp.]
MLAAGAPAQGSGHDPGRQTAAHHAQTNPKYDFQPSPLIPVQDSINRVASAIETANNKRPTQEDRDNTRRNLEAQEKIAKWAPAVFWVALAELFITALGIILIGLTLKWTRKAVIDNGRQHALTERANIVPGIFNRELSTGADELSKHLKSALPPPRTIAQAELDVTYFAVQPVWVNTGSTTTEKMKIRVDWCDDDERPIGSYRYAWQTFFVAPNSVEPSEFIEMPGLNALIQNGFAGTVTHPAPRRLIWGTAEYNDIFGTKHWLRWCYRIRASRPNPGQGLKISLIQWGDYNAASDKAD